MVSGIKLRVLAVLDDVEQGAQELEALIGADYKILCCDAEFACDAASGSAIAAAFVDSNSGGVPLLAKLSAERPDTRRILICRGGHEPDGLEEALEAAQIDYVLRPPLASRQASRAIGLLLSSFRRERASMSALSSLRRLARSSNPDELTADPSEAAETLSRAARLLDAPGYRDATTGLYSANSFQERLREEVARARRYDKQLSLIHVDLDNFTDFNQQTSWLVGDDAISAVATLLGSRTGETSGRESDIVGRLSGQEFAILLPETAAAGGEIKAERVRQAIESIEFDGVALSACLGVASFPRDARGPLGLMQRAREATATAKGDGKNRVELSTRGSADAALHHERAQFTYYHGHLDEITNSLERDLSVSVLFADLGQLRGIEREFGVTAHAELFARAGELLADTRGSCLRREDRLFRTEDADGYLCFLAPPRDKDGQPAPLDLDSIARRVQKYLSEGLTDDLSRLTREPARIFVGYARVLANPMARSERLILKVIADARESARLISKRNSLREKAVLQDIILRQQLNAVYQPIVQLESGDIFGFEALTRGPKDTPLESPTALFGVADEVDLMFELDRACFRGGLRSAEGLSPVHRLFVNLLPQSFYDTRFIEGEVERLLEKAGLTPANVVFEITERLAIENFTAFRHALTTYTAMGFGVAIDDVGTRHSNLETVMALQPHFIKVSDILTRGVSRSTVKREMLRSLQRIAEAIDAVIVAEGIEDADDLEVLADVGVRYGQGFYLARPGPAFPDLLLERQQEIRSISAEAMRSRTNRLQVVRLHDEDEKTEEHRAGAPKPAASSTSSAASPAGSSLGRGSGSVPIQGRAAPEADEPPRDDTKPHLVLPAQPGWRPLSAEDLGRPSEEASLLEELLDDTDPSGKHKRSAN